MGINLNNEYTRIYEKLRGTDLSSLSNAENKRFYYLENMYVDHEGGGGLESIPGFRKILSLNSKINGIFSQKCNGEEYVIVHSGKNVYRFPLSNRDNLTSATPILQGLQNKKCSAIMRGEMLYLFDGNTIAVIDQNATARFFNTSGFLPYVPTTHINGEKYEPRNLLTPSFCQKLILRSPEKYQHGTPGLSYTIIDYDERLCAVSGSETDIEGDLYIPTQTVIGGITFKVCAVSDFAFMGNKKITRLFTGDSLLEIGHKAFADCTSLTEAVLSKTVKSIGTYSFYGCSALSNFYIGEGFSKFGTCCFDLCTSLHELYYAKSYDDFLSVEGKGEFEDRYVNYNHPYREILLSIPLYGNIKSISSVTLGGEEVEFSYNSGESGVIIAHPNRTLIEGREIAVCGEFAPEGEGFLSTELGKRLSSEECILKCTLSAYFDGRIFLSGNPELPGAVFYSSVTKEGEYHPLYFSVSDYFVDDSGGNRVTALTVNDDSLTVLLNGDGGSGSIFVHKAQGEGSSAKYPLSYIHKGITSAGGAISFMGEVLFVCSLGICALEKDTDKDYIHTVCRSSKISRALLSENLSEINLTKWRGYLVAQVNGNIYLADSRDKYSQDGSFGYEWYYLTGIGSYKKDNPTYRYLSCKKEGYSLSPTPDKKAEGTIYSVKNEKGELLFYSIENGEKISVYPTEEREGGTFYPITAITAIGELLFFGTSCGDVCLFNSDKRGVAPPYISEKDGFDPEEYKSSMGNLIHPYYYSFDTHRASYCLITPPDNCGLPHLEKNTVRASATVKFRCFSDAELIIKTKTDKKSPAEIARFRCGALDFDTLDFSSLSLCTDDAQTLTLDDSDRGWIEKQYIITSSGFREPIGIDSLSFGYRIKGKIKNR